MIKTKSKGIVSCLLLCLLFGVFFVLANGQSGKCFVANNNGSLDPVETLLSGELTAVYVGGNVRENETLDVTQIDISIVYEDTTEVLEYNAEGVEYLIDDTQIDILNYTFDSLGLVNILVRYNNLSAFMTVTVGEPRIVSLTASYTDRVHYGEKLNLNFLSINLNYSDETVDELKPSDVYFYDGTVLLNPEEFVFQRVGLNVITLKWVGDINFSCNLEFNVKAGYTVSFLDADTQNLISKVENAFGVTQYTIPEESYNPPAGKKFKTYVYDGAEIQAGDTIELTDDIFIDVVWEDKNVEQSISSADAGSGADVREIFTTANENLAQVVLNVGKAKVTFDNDAVSAISQSGEIAFSMITSDSVSNVSLPGAVKTLDISINGFTSGKAIVEVPFAVVPVGKIAKVYYVDNSGKIEDMNAIFQNGTAKFETTHFSKYIIAFEDEVTTTQTEAKGGLPGIAIAGIIVGAVVVIILAGFCAYRLSNRQENQ